MEAEPISNSEFYIRRQKLSQLRKDQIPYAAKFERTHTLKEASGLHDGDTVAICGRITAKRNFGGLIFMNLSDIGGTLQISASADALPAACYRELEREIDVADFLGVEGTFYHTKSGEPTVKVSKYKLLSKALRSLPEKYHGLSNMNLRYRQRYLDLIMNPEARDVFLKRSQVTCFIRNFLDSNGFIELETPILQNIASGAAARPFITRHHTLDMDLYLRIAPELYLKQAIAGGFDRVFEIGKNFRNEGMDASHLQEFTMLEWYAAYWDYQDNIAFIRKLLLALLDTISGTRQIECGGHVIDFGAEWTRIDFSAEISKLIQSDILDYTELNALKTVIKKYALLSDDDLNKSVSIPSLIDLLYKRRIRPYIIQPTLLCRYPACLIPLARRNDEDNRVIDMFQLVVNGWEIVKAYSELIDPEIQRGNFMEQAKNRNSGDTESFAMDTNFLTAMEHGMPPISGLGLGIDRLVALLCNQTSLRDVVLFPVMK